MTGVFGVGKDVAEQLLGRVSQGPPSEVRGGTVAVFAQGVTTGAEGAVVGEPSLIVAMPFEAHGKHTAKVRERPAPRGGLL
jgi:hypothetical protein